MQQIAVETKDACHVQLCCVHIKDFCFKSEIIRNLILDAHRSGVHRRRVHNCYTVSDIAMAW